MNLTAFGTKARPPPPAAECRANNLQPKRKGLSILFATVDGTKQGVCRAEQAQARADDYATAAEGREKPPNTARFFFASVLGFEPSRPPLAEGEGGRGLGARALAVRDQASATREKIRRIGRAPPRTRPRQTNVIPMKDLMRCSALLR